MGSKGSGPTMACLFQGITNTSLVIELKDHSSIQGILKSCDNGMNMDMERVTVYSSKEPSKPVHFDYFHVRGKFIRFVHFDHYFNAAKVISKSLNYNTSRGKC